MYTLGIDIGSTSSKGIILKDGCQVIGQALAAAGTGTSGPSQVLKELFNISGVRQEEIIRTVATGYGRMSLKQADRQISELSCHAKGVHFLFPQVHTVIDIGGQDAKAMRVDSRGKLMNFAMNDKCAAGTGRFLDVMAKVLELEVAQLGTISKQAQCPAEISSICTVFAESEVISRLSEGAEVADIVAGIHRSIAQRVGALVFKVGIEAQVVMTGGVAQNSGVVAAMMAVIKMPIVVPDCAPYTGAIGAALYAYEDRVEVKK